MIDNDKLLSEVFNKLNEMSKEELTEILKKAALRKEKIMRPLIKSISGWGSGTEVLYKCRKCGASFKILSDHEKYCHNCGTPVDWDKVKRFLPQDVADFYHSLSFSKQQEMLTLMNTELEFYPLKHYEYLKKNREDYNRREFINSNNNITVVYGPYGNTKQDKVDNKTKLYTLNITSNYVLDIYDNKTDNYCKVCNEKMEYTDYKLTTGPIYVRRKCPKCGFAETMTDEGLTVEAGKKRIMFAFFPLCINGRIEAQEMIDEYKKELIG